MAGAVSIKRFTYRSERGWGENPWSTHLCRVLVSMGSVVTKDMPDNVVVKGSPAKPICENIFEVSDSI
jgi:hypothetical protein